MPTNRPLRRAVFLDRDGTLNREVTYLHRIEDLAWIPGAPEAIRRLNEAGLLTIVVTNQAGVAHGYYAEEDVRQLHAHMQALLKQEGAWIDAYYYCPYHPEGAVPAYRRASPFRKPGTGMFEEAIEAWAVAPDASFMVGDKESDIVPARALGMTSILVETGYGRRESVTTTADYVEPDIGAAVGRILQVCTTTPSKTT